jgi:hypothetical protein
MQQEFFGFVKPVRFSEKKISLSTVQEQKTSPADHIFSSLHFQEELSERRGCPAHFLMGRSTSGNNRPAENRSARPAPSACRP